MTKRYHLASTKTFSKSIFEWRPLADFVECFGQGVLALLPRGIEYKAVSLASSFKTSCSRNMHGPETRAANKRALPWLLQVLKQRRPALQYLCDEADRVLTSPLLKDGRILETRAAELYRENREKEARGLSFLGRLAEPRGLGSQEGLGVPDELVRQILEPSPSTNDQPNQSPRPPNTQASDPALDAAESDYMSDNDAGPWDDADLMASIP